MFCITEQYGVDKEIFTLRDITQHTLVLHFTRKNSRRQYFTKKKIHKNIFQKYFRGQYFTRKYFQTPYFTGKIITQVEYIFQIYAEGIACPHTFWFSRFN